jgi:hypothetical protein
MGMRMEEKYSPNCGDGDEDRKYFKWRGKE